MRPSWPEKVKAKDNEQTLFSRDCAAENEEKNHGAAEAAP
jgi:hypothetical protein